MCDTFASPILSLSTGIYAIKSLGLVFKIYKPPATNNTVSVITAVINWIEHTAA